jgi:hypothetical protein
MSGPAARSTMALALVLLALALTASSGAATPSSHGPMLGVVSHAGARGAAAAVSLGPAVYHGGAVMSTNTTYAIYWVPNGFSVDASYESLIDRYLGDVAAASGSQSNVYAVATQYYDMSASIQYASTFGGSYVDTRPFPANGCDDGQDAVCLTDAQLQQEIQTVIGARGWHEGTSSLFFVMTPDGVGSCFDAGGTQCTTNVYCAYHSDFFDSNTGRRVIYANEPYAGTIFGCTRPGGTQGFPNDHDADATINTISHEHNEAVTDPFGDAWWANDTDGNEIADLCAGDFSSVIGTTGGQPYNQLINGHAYSLQLEYSNDNAACAAGYTPTSAPVSAAPPVLSGSAGLGQLLSTSNGAWAHAPSGYAYKWQRCSASGSSCADISGATASAYRVSAADAGQTLRAEVSAHNVAGASSYFASATSTVVVAAPSSTTAPILSGVAAVGKKLSTTAGTWSAAAAFSYEWLRCTAAGIGCSTIAGATSATYVPGRADAGHALRARVTATNAAGAAAALSNGSSVVIGTPSARRAPHIAGRARIGRRLSASRGSWSGTPQSYRYQWLRCNAHGGSCVLIKHATRPKYRLTRSDVRHRLRVRVTAINTAGSSKATSRATSSVPHRR